MAKGRPLEIGLELVEAFRHSGLVNEYLIGAIPRALWFEVPPGGGRSIAGIFAHMQSVRRTFARLGGGGAGPPSLDAKRLTAPQGRRAMRRTTDDLCRLFEQAFADGRPRVKGMPRRAVNMLTYLLQHDAHHRGQICTIARRFGHEFTADDVMRIWGWKKMP
jgi:uncharacterized damage-inducible protein DinB